MKHNYTLKTQVKQWVVEISPSTFYGYFESDKTGNGGGLWFDQNKTLIDYDGVFELSLSVIQAIESLGYNADYEKEEDF